MGLNKARRQLNCRNLHVHMSYVILGISLAFRFPIFDEKSAFHCDPTMPWLVLHCESDVKTLFPIHCKCHKTKLPSSLTGCAINSFLGFKKIAVASYNPIDNIVSREGGAKAIPLRRGVCPTRWTSDRVRDGTAVNDSTSLRPAMRNASAAAE